MFNLQKESAMPVSHHPPIGERIRTVRQRNGIRQKDLAKAVGISHGALTNFEKGRRRNSIGWLEKIADALDTSVAYFSKMTHDRAPGTRRNGDCSPRGASSLRCCSEISCA